MIGAVLMSHYFRRQVRYRGLRGIVRHLIPLVREKGSVGLGRDPVGTFASNKRGGDTFGTCRWCGLPATNTKTGGKRKWHTSCVRYHSLARGRGEPYIKKTDCRCGKPGTELDHKVSIGVAARLGERDYVKAFLPENLEWLCRVCHKAKTNNDRKKIRALDRAGEMFHDWVTDQIRNDGDYYPTGD